MAISIVLLCFCFFFLSCLNRKIVILFDMLFGLNVCKFQCSFVVETFGNFGVCCVQTFSAIISNYFKVVFFLKFSINVIHLASSMAIAFISLRNRNILSFKVSFFFQSYKNCALFLETIEILQI